MNADGTDKCEKHGDWRKYYSKAITVSYTKVSRKKNGKNQK